MTFDHMTCDTSQGAPLGAAALPVLVVQCAMRCSDSLSNSIVKAKRTAHSSVGNGRLAAMPT